MKKSGTVIHGRQSESPAPRHLPLVDILIDTQAELQELVVTSGLKVLEAMLEEDRVAVCGPRYAHQPARRAYRAGHAPSEVVLGGRKVAVRRPRVRRDGHEVPLPSVQAFTHTDPLNRRIVDDTLAFYGAAGARGARVVVPPTKTASVSRRGARSGARDRTIRRVKALGRRRWKKASGYHQHARVENAFFRYKSIVGDCLRARSSSGQRREAVLACNVLNRMTELGRPVSYRIGRRRGPRGFLRRLRCGLASGRRPSSGGAATGTRGRSCVTSRQHGDVRYLEEARKALADHRTLWGLDAPQRVDLRASRNPFAEMTDDALREELARQSRLLAVGEPISADPPLTEAERHAP